jgi:hypothetical protein
MPPEKPRFEAYARWLKDNHDVELSRRSETHYQSVTTKLRQDFESSDFWTHLLQNLPEYGDRYQIETSYPLFAPDNKPTVLVKSYASFLLKTYRRNISENRRWPDPPAEGWILPSNWYSRINDILRTLLVVKYLDGVQYLIDQVRTCCQEQAMPSEVHLEAREEGYYAAHMYTRRDFEIPKLDWDTELAVVSIEIQITTQLQEVIRRLLHKYYETRRVATEATNGKWQWDYHSEEFSANYLGHILHYVEGMIMEVRDRDGK